jgi:small subunit ribosomal protein S20
VANSPQARKRARQATTHNKRNAAARSKFRTAIKKVVYAIESGDKSAAESAYNEATPIIDSSCNKGLIQSNKAARHKSRLNSRIRAMS